MDTVQTKQNLIKRLLRHREDLRRLGVQRLGLFGSFQRGAPDAERDADLSVEFAPGERDYTKERRERLKDTSIDGVMREIKKRRKRRTK